MTAEVGTLHLVAILEKLSPATTVYSDTEAGITEAGVGSVTIGELLVGSAAVTASGAAALLGSNAGAAGAAWSVFAVSFSFWQPCMSKASKATP